MTKGAGLTDSQFRLRALGRQGESWGSGFGVLRPNPRNLSPHAAQALVFQTTLAGQPNVRNPKL